MAKENERQGTMEDKRQGTMEDKRREATRNNEARDDETRDDKRKRGTNCNLVFCLLQCLVFKVSMSDCG